MGSFSATASRARRARRARWARWAREAGPLGPVGARWSPLGPLGPLGLLGPSGPSGPLSPNLGKDYSPSFQRMRTMWWKYKEPSRYSSWQLANSSFWFCTAGPGRGPPPWFMFCMIGVPNSVYSLQPLQPALATTRREILGVARDAERSGSTTFGNKDVHRIDRDEPWTWIYGFGNVLMQTRSVISPFFTLKKETQNGKNVKWIGTTDPTLGEHPSHDHWPSLVFDRGWIRRPPLRSFLFTRAGLRCSCGETQRCAVRVRGLFFFVPLINT